MWVMQRHIVNVILFALSMLLVKHILFNMLDVLLPKLKNKK